MTLSLFPADSLPAEIIDDGAVLLRGFAAAEEQRWVAEVPTPAAGAGFRICRAIATAPSIRRPASPGLPYRLFWASRPPGRRRWPAIRVLHPMPA